MPRVPPKLIFQHVGNSIKIDASPYDIMLHGSGVYKGIANKWLIKIHQIKNNSGKCT